MEERYQIIEVKAPLETTLRVKPSSGRTWRLIELAGQKLGWQIVVEEKVKKVEDAQT